MADMNRKIIESMFAAENSTDSDQPVKRGPGRPRKAASCLPPEPAPDDTSDLRAISSREVMSIMGISSSSLQRLNQSDDPDWPRPFSLVGPAKNHYLLADVLAFLRKKAADARAAKDRAEQQPERSTIKPVSRPTKAKPVETAQMNQRKAAN
ncbi:hypothetical protein M0D69_04740 [Caballeronia sp. SEWSISQ10-4 2]|uniref:hypothetical protein n=1 Tax=Caballeronia sp. SEWSISQ10-4 2 TaxID=2937438 RepID=UPI0026507AE6|nr:hypothetical protein [Caballeronia sp. SEWSISQ10-4 2]MDN7177331.1 hypothetical protein [Caballeronia sp. SEWSISQ10-4 2]